MANLVHRGPIIFARVYPSNSPSAPGCPGIVSASPVCPRRGPVPINPSLQRIRTTKPIPRWDVHFGGLDDDRKGSTAPHTAFRPQLGGHRKCGLAICTFHLGFSLVPPWGLEFFGQDPDAPGGPGPPGPHVDQLALSAGLPQDAGGQVPALLHLQPPSEVPEEN